MVISVNGDRGNSVIPIEWDDYMFLGRGRHVIVDGRDVKMRGSSGNNIVEGIGVSENGNIASIRAVSASMKLVYPVPLGSPDNYMLFCGGWAI